MRFDKLFRWRKDRQPASESDSRSLSRALADPVTALVCTGIVNPYGPTMTVGGFLGAPGNEGTTPLIRIMLNPFSQEFEQIGAVSPGDATNPVALMDRLLPHLSFESCPTLLLPSVHVPSDDAPAVYGELLRRFATAREVFDRVGRFYGDPWERVSEEMQAAFKSALTSSDSRSSQLMKRLQEPLERGEAEEFAKLILSREHALAEIEAFEYAWNGAISQAPQLPAMNFARFALYFHHLTKSCVLPGS